MAKVVLRQEAINDLSDIWDYTVFTWSEQQADKYHQKIKMACNDIAKSPIIGKSYSKIDHQLYGYNVGKHIIFYQIISNERVEVIRILHERMDLFNKLSK